MDKIYHAYYSQKAVDNGMGSSVYLSIDGFTEVIVTCVDESKERLEENYLWKDKVYVGQVTKFLRVHTRDKFMSERQEHFYMPFVDENGKIIEWERRELIRPFYEGRRIW